jgi:hypothetical protein
LWLRKSVSKQARLRLTLVLPLVLPLVLALMLAFVLVLVLVVLGLFGLRPTRFLRTAFP